MFTSKYFISYYFQDKDGMTGFGNYPAFTWKGKITPEHIPLIESHIKDLIKVDKVAIIFFKKV